MAFANSFDIGAVLNACSTLKEREDFTGSLHIKAKLVLKSKMLFILTLICTCAI